MAFDFDAFAAAAIAQPAEKKAEAPTKAVELKPLVSLCASPIAAAAQFGNSLLAGTAAGIVRGVALSGTPQAAMEGAANQALLDACSADAGLEKAYRVAAERFARAEAKAAAEARKAAREAANAKAAQLLASKGAVLASMAQVMGALTCGGQVERKALSLTIPADGFGADGRIKYFVLNGTMHTL